MGQLGLTEDPRRDIEAYLRPDERYKKSGGRRSVMLVQGIC
jgi:hypothetical protein